MEDPFLSLDTGCVLTDPVEGLLALGDTFPSRAGLFLRSQSSVLSLSLLCRRHPAPGYGRQRLALRHI